MDDTERMRIWRPELRLFPVCGDLKFVNGRHEVSLKSSAIRAQVDSDAGVGVADSLTTILRRNGRPNARRARDRWDTLQRQLELMEDASAAFWCFGSNRNPAVLNEFGGNTREAERIAPMIKDAAMRYSIPRYGPSQRYVVACVDGTDTLIEDYDYTHTMED